MEANKQSPVRDWPEVFQRAPVLAQRWAETQKLPPLNLSLIVRAVTRPSRHFLGIKCITQP